MNFRARRTPSSLASYGDRKGKRAEGMAHTALHMPGMALQENGCMDS